MRDAFLVLVVHPDAYELLLDGKVLARLDGGATALLAGTGERLRDLDVEAAIERSEDWLMPSSKLMSGLELRVHDETGRVRKTLGEQAIFSATDVEQAFTRAFDAVAHGRAPDRNGVADIVLLRELVHHGKLSGIKA